MGYFKLKAKTKISDIKPDDKIEESDFCTLTNEGDFIQLEYVDNEEIKKEYDVKPGVWVIQANQERGMFLEKTSFVNDKILKEFLLTKEIVSKVDMFFNRLHVYAKHGIEIPKRNGLLYGPPGTGKSSSITEVVEKYSKDNKTAIVIWPTTKFKAFNVKDFIKTFNYIEGVERLIFIAEDIGGTEYDMGKMESNSSLLSLLDNQEKTFKIPVYILSTTNFPETLLSNLGNRYGRFDDKIEVGYPSAEQREALYNFLSDRNKDEETIKYLKSGECAEFTPAHIREVIIRSDLHDKEHLIVMKEINKEVKLYKNEFKNNRRSSMSILGEYDD